MTPDQLAVFQDARMSREARMVALHISCYGEGEHEIPNAEFRQLLGRGARGMVKDQTLASYVGELEDYGWVTKNPGGQGSPRYIFTPPQKDSKREALPTLGSFTIPQKVGKKSVYPPTEGDQSTPVVVGEEEVVGEVGETREAFDIDEKVQDLLDREESDVVGLRDSLVDYLTDRVQPDRQWGYVSSIRSWFDGSPSAPRGLHRLEPLEQRKLLASALNELLQTDEVSEFRSARGKVGEISTLRTKVEYLLRRIKKPEDPSSSGAEKPSRRKSVLPDPEVSHAS